MNVEIVLVILLMTAVTYGARVIPFILLRNKKLDGILKNFIQLVPVALLAALVLPELFLNAENEISIFSPYLFAGICTFIFARIVPNLFLTVLVGMISYWGFDKII